jgi:amidase
MPAHPGAAYGHRRRKAGDDEEPAMTQATMTENDDFTRPGGLTGMRAVDIARAVRERRVTPEAVIRAHLDRIAAADPVIRAFQAVRADGALADAEALGRRDDLGTLPLAGVPVAVKDNIDVAGLPTRHGSAATPFALARRDDELVRRLRQAGAIPVGKTQLPELAIWPFTEPVAFPATRNPWDLSRTPGGSTGGGAAAVATGMAALALGSDGGGSIRIPAACCGITGIKPGPGVVPLAGGASQHWHGLTAFGPLARCAADAAAMLHVLSGGALSGDTGTGDAGLGTLAPPRPLRIAVSARHPAPGARVAPAVRAALDEAAGLLRAAGHTVTWARPPYPANLGLRFSQRWLAGIAEDAQDLPADALEARTRAMVRRGQRAARRVRPAAADPFAARATEWLGRYDVLLTPTLARAAVPLGTWAGKGWVRTMLGVGNWLYTTPWNLAGLPAASVPFGCVPSGSDAGLPLGLQIVAPAGGEPVVLALAAQLEQLRP